MSRSTRMAVFAALATVLSALAVAPVIDGTVWYLESVGAVMVVAVVGEGARRAGFPRPVGPLVQLCTLAGWLTFIFARQQALFGELPAIAVWLRFLQTTQAAVIDVGRYVAPVPSDSAVIAFVVAGVGLVALLADLFAATLRLPAVAGLPLVTLYLVPVAVVGTVHAALFVLGGIGYLALLVAERRDALTRFGPTLAPENRAARENDPAPDPAPGWQAVGRRLSGLGRSSGRIGAVVLAAAVTVPVILPAALTGGLLTPEDLLPSEDTTFDSTGPRSVTTVDPTVSLYRDLNLASNITLLRVRTSSKGGGEAAGLGTSGEYLRLATLDHFDGKEWTPSHRDARAVPDPLPPVAELSNDVARHRASTTIWIRGTYRSQWLPLPNHATRVEVGGDWRYDREDGDIAGVSGQTTAGLSYQVRSLDVVPTRKQLEAASKPSDQILDRYTQVPDDLPAIVARLAHKVTDGAKTPYDKAVALQQWFTDPTQFTYDTTVKSGDTDSALAQFLRDRIGYCQQFAGTMAAMARLLGIPARVVVGFTPGIQQPDGSYLVGAHDAHAWPELYFAGSGWVRFEPTPTIADGRGSSPSWATPPQDGSIPSTLPTADPQARADGASSPPSTGESPEPDLRADRSGALVTDPGPDTGASIPIRPMAAAALALLLALLLASVPLQARQFVRRRRARAGPDPARSAQAAWSELADHARDLGYTWQDALTVRQAASRLRNDADLGPAQTSSLQRLVRATEMARYSAAPRLEGDLFADVRTVGDGLAGHRGVLTRWRARLLPPTVLGYLPRLVRVLRRPVPRSWGRAVAAARALSDRLAATRALRDRH